MKPQMRTRPDQSAASRLIVAVDSEGWNVPLTPGQESANPDIAVNGWHSAVLMCAAGDTGWQAPPLWHDGTRREANPAAGLARNYGLATTASCDYLVSLPWHALVCGFYWSYDLNKLVADLPLTALDELAREKPLTTAMRQERTEQVCDLFGYTPARAEKTVMPNHRHLVDQASTIHGQYWISYTSKKRLDIVDLAAGRIPVITQWTGPDGTLRQADKPEWKWARSVTVWDVFSFFQKSFVGALKDYRCGHCPACKSKPRGHCEIAPWSPADLKRIASMKQGRPSFDPAARQEIETYCTDECRYLAFLVRDLLVHTENFGVRLKSFHGSGALASEWMKGDKTRGRPSVKSFMPQRSIAGPGTGEQFSAPGLPEYVALCAYYGGRFEVRFIGPCGWLRMADINSAYPHIIRGLPCLAHGTWRHVTSYEPGKTGVYLTGSHTSGPWAPFPFRTGPDMNAAGLARGALYYAHEGRRWVWHPEVEAARRAFGDEAIPVYEGYVLDSECDHVPFADVPGMYELRKQYVSEGNGVEKVIKLLLNSLAGKTMQSIGWTLNEHTGVPQPPPFQCWVWAGLITSGTRAMILDALYQPGADVVSVATDGILSRTPLKLNTGDAPAGDGSLWAPPRKELGAWETGEAEDGWLFQSGVYTMLVPCKKGDECDDPGHVSQHERTSSGKQATRIYKTRGFAAREIPAAKLIAAWEAGGREVESDPGQTRFVTLRGGLKRVDGLEYIGQWIPSAHKTTFDHNRRLPLLPDEALAAGDFAARCSDSEPCVIYPPDLVSAPYEPKGTWEDVMEDQPDSDDVDFAEATPEDLRRPERD